MLGAWLFLAFIFIIGCFIGSFLNVLIWRLPEDMKVTGRSFCPHCKHKLGVFDLVPVLSYIFAGGKCRYCKTKISARYPIIELITGFLFAATWFLVLLPDWGFTLGSWLISLKFAFILSVIIVVFVIDLEHYLILNKVVFPATLIVYAFALLFDVLGGSLIALHGSLFNAIVGSIAGFLPFYLLWKISKGRWIGLGDAKYGLFLGAVFGFPFVYLSYFLACFLGTIFAIPLLITGKKHLSSKLPLGTFLSIGAVLTIWFGAIILGWYLTAIGF